jgi:hypothetical protein
VGQKPKNGAGKKRSHDAVEEDVDSAPEKRSDSTSTKSSKTKKAKTEKDAASAPDKKPESTSTKGPKAKKAQTEDKNKYNVSDISLDGEENGCVPVFDTCADIRRKISAHERKGVTTKKAMLEAFNASAQQYKTFMKGSKSMQGAEKDIFYGAYVYFEKLRIKEEKKKSKKREDMEKVWGRNGVPREQNDRLLLMKGEHAFWNQYGQLEINGVVQR